MTISPSTIVLYGPGATKAGVVQTIVPGSSPGGSRYLVRRFMPSGYTLTHPQAIAASQIRVVGPSSRGMTFGQLASAIAKLRRAS